MYSVFIVDDEPIVLEGIRTKIDWESSGFVFAGEAGDGEIALSMIHEIKPDILITDIKMPFMDGLTLAASVKKIQPFIKIIILSGHDEFDYAKKAISIGIEDYILKPFTSDEILSALNKAAKDLDVIHSQLSDISKMKEELKSKERLLQNEFLNDLVHGYADMSKAMQKSQELGIELIARYYKILVSKLNCTEANSQSLEEICSLVNSYSSSWENTNCFFHQNNRIVCICKGATVDEVDENIFHIAETIEHIVKEKQDSYVLTGIGKTVEHLSSLSTSYEDAKRMINFSYSTGQNKIISSDDIQMNSTDLLELKEKDPMVVRLRYAGKNDVSAIVEESLNLLKSNPEQSQFFASYILADLIFAVSKLVENLGGNLKELKPEIVQRNFIDEAIYNEEQFVTKLESVLNFALEYRDSTVSGRYTDVILKAKKYIEENYSDQNTTLTKVADIVCLSPNHFSAIFSQQCKTTFIEYLTSVRIENAKRLLRNSDKKGYDIAYECGFSDPHYFSYIFKKNTGLSPREYKASSETN